MINRQWEAVSKYKCELGEGPVWDHQHERICWVDILPGIVHFYYPKTRAHKIFKLGQMVGSVALRRNGGLVAAVKGGFATIDVERGTTWMISQVEGLLPDIRFNDGKCDQAGRFWAGTMSISNVPGSGSLYVLEKDYSIQTKIKGVSCSNGMAWSPDNRTFYYIDTPTLKVVSYDFNVEYGQISNQRDVVRIQEHTGYPDGMTIDSDGMLWIALWGGWKVVRYDPKSGQQLDEIKLPVSNVSSCVFGGPALEDLYITTASTGISATELTAQKLAGSLFVVRNCGYRGIRPFEFEG